MNESYKTRGVVLHTIRHGDSGFIAFVYTEDFARVPYYIRSRNGKAVAGRAKIPLQPLTLLEIVGHKGRTDFHYIEEATRLSGRSGAPADIRKAAIVLFLSEVFYRILREGEPDKALFRFLSDAVLSLETIEKGVANYHLYILTQLTRYMGLAPGNDYAPDNFFDIAKGLFVMLRPTHGNYFEPSESRFFDLFLRTPSDRLDTIAMNRQSRLALLSALIDFFSYHHGTRYRINSLEMLGEIF